MITPINQRLPVVLSLSRENTACSRHLTEIAVGDLVERAGLNHTHGTGSLLNQSRCEGETSSSSADNDIVVRAVVSRDSKGRAKGDVLARDVMSQ